MCICVRNIYTYIYIPHTCIDRHYIYIYIYIFVHMCVGGKKMMLIGYLFERHIIQYES